MKTTVIHHSTDFDGLFCREIARKFLPDAELIGWDFKDAPLPIPEGQIYIMDLPVDRVFGFVFKDGEAHKDGMMVPKSEAERWGWWDRIIWIDHHKSSIDSHPSDIPGYRIDGVAACRLAWQWFSELPKCDTCGSDNSGSMFGKNAGETCREFGCFGTMRLPTKQDFIDRKVSEPWAVRLAGEYDIWDKRDPDAELFQHGLRSEELYQNTWDSLLGDGHTSGSALVVRLLNQGRALQFARANEYREVIIQQGFDVQFEGLTFLACNSHELDIRSQLFAAGIQPHHDALLGFTYNGVSKDWRVSMYRIPGREDRDILSIAKKYGGGGHPGACGFRTVFPIWMLPFRADGRITPQTADARVWARQWLETIHMHPELPKDENAMITWFSNAIMAGVDEADRRK